MNKYLGIKDVGMLVPIVAMLAFPPAVRSDDASQAASATAFDESRAFALSQSAIGRRIGDYQFKDSHDRDVSISSYLGRPIIVSFVYTSCHHTCPLITRRLATAVDAARAVFGADGFQVLSVGFDAKVDSPDRMRAFAGQQGADGPGWAFVSADEEVISAFSSDLGFVFFPSPKGFDHLAQISILDGDGRVYRQIYGDEFDPPAIIEPLKEIALGRREGNRTVTDWIYGIRLFCTTYDPASGRYRFDYSIIVAAITGIIGLGTIAIFLIHGWRQHRASGRSDL